MKICPKCKRGYPDFQQRCECGFAFTERHVKKTKNSVDSDRHAATAVRANIGPVWIFLAVVAILGTIIWLTYAD